MLYSSFQKCRTGRNTTRQLMRLVSSNATAEKNKASPMMRLSLLTAGGMMGGTVLAVKYMHDEVGGMEALNRTVSFYSLAIPKYIQYRTHMFLDSPDETWDQLDKETSQQGLEKILSLRGFYIKSGQMVATNIGNGFPPIWQETFSVLQDGCPHKPFDVVRAIIESEYGKPLEQVFSSFDEVPIGAASIGQVHRATLHNGQEVVVKIMYPEVEDLFRGDVRTIKMFAQVAQPVHVPPLEEVEKQFMTEFDYVQEAKQMEQVRLNLEKAGLAGKNKLAVVPKAYMDFCTKRVLVMEELKGEKLPDAIQRDIEQYAKKAGMSVDQFKLQEEMKVRELKKQGKDTMGPSAAEFDAYIKLETAKNKAQNASTRLYNYTIGWIPGFQKKEYVSNKTLPLNYAKLIDDLIMIHGHEVLVDGYFNGDCHPGNILMLNSKKQLGLIDYGQVKNLSKEERLRMCRLILALADDNKEEIIDIMKESGFRSKTMNEDVIYKFAKVSYDEDNDELTNGQHIQLFMESLQAKDPIDAIPENYIMVGRTSVMLRGFAHALRQSRSIAKAWAPIAQKVLDSEQ